MINADLRDVPRSWSDRPRFGTDLESPSATTTIARRHPFERVEATDAKSTEASHGRFLPNKATPPKPRNAARLSEYGTEQNTLAGVTHSARAVLSARAGRNLRARRRRG